MEAGEASLKETRDSEIFPIILLVSQAILRNQIQ